MQSCTFFEYTREILDVPGRTVQLNMLGGGPVLTDEPENIKAVMLTKVSYPKIGYWKAKWTKKASFRILAKAKSLTKSLRMSSETLYFQVSSSRHHISMSALGSNKYPLHCQHVWGVGNGVDGILADGPLWVANKNQLRPYVSAQ